MSASECLIQGAGSRELRPTF